MTLHGEIVLPSGLERDGARHRTAAVRPLCGADEVFLAEVGARMLPASRTTALLERCVTRIGSLPGDAETLRALTVGDREALLLHVRRITFGDDVECILRCPEEQCGERMELPLSIGDLLAPPYAAAPAVHEARFAVDGATYAVRFRLPTGAAQERAALIARTDVSRAVEALVDACVEAVTGPDGTTLERVPERLIDALSGRMAELDPQAETTIQATCPACATVFEASFDACSHLCEELAGAAIFREVHVIASRYHWSEEAIFALTPQRRRTYLSLIRQSSAGAPA